jgi:glycosyltransferase involved in cell wall biosynthesis
MRRAGIDVFERHVDLFHGRERIGRGPLAAARVLAAETRLLVRPRSEFDVLVVGYPGHFDMPRARRVAGRKPLVFVPLVALEDELVRERRRFRARSMAARVLETVDARALRAADAVVADSDVTAAFLAELGGLAGDRVARIFVGAEERVFAEEWTPVYPFGALHVAGAGASVEIVRAAAALVDVPVTVDETTPYEELGVAYGRAGIALGSFVESRRIPDAAFSALATGTPLVTADTAAARELLVDGESALLVPPGDAEALAAAIRRVAEDRDLLVRIAHGGRRVYEERASEDVLGAEWRALLERQTGIA